MTKIPQYYRRAHSSRSVRYMNLQHDTYPQTTSVDPSLSPSLPPARPNLTPSRSVGFRPVTFLRLLVGTCTALDPVPSRSPHDPIGKLQQYHSLLSFSEDRERL